MKKILLLEQKLDKIERKLIDAQYQISELQAYQEFQERNKPNMLI